MRAHRCLLAFSSAPAFGFRLANTVLPSSKVPQWVNKFPIGVSGTPHAGERKLKFSSSLFAVVIGDDRLIKESVPLSSGVTAEVVTSLGSSKQEGQGMWSMFSPKQKEKKPLLIFLHGSFHASWCWEEHYMPYFLDQGYQVAAFSFRGTGGTYAGDGVKKVKMEEHVDDLCAFLDWIQPEKGVVLIAHSFGGLAIMKYLERRYATSSELTSGQCELRGIALLCSVPPSGNGPMTLRFLQRSLRDSWKITAGLAMKKCITDKALCRTLFFARRDDEETDGLSDAEIERYQGYFERDTVATIDLADLAKTLPSLYAVTTSSEQGGSKRKSASYLSKMPKARLVVGAMDDFIVDREGVEETAAFFGKDGPIIVDSPHDVMLGPMWKNGADAILRWLEAEVNGS